MYLWSVNNSVFSVSIFFSFFFSAAALVGCICSISMCLLQARPESQEKFTILCFFSFFASLVDSIRECVSSVVKCISQKARTRQLNSSAAAALSHRRRHTPHVRTRQKCTSHFYTISRYTTHEEPTIVQQLQHVQHENDTNTVKTALWIYAEILSKVQCMSVVKSSKNRVVQTLPVYDDVVCRTWVVCISILCWVYLSACSSAAAAAPTQSRTQHTMVVMEKT